MKASSSADYRVTLEDFTGIGNIPGTWSRATGGNKAAEARRYRDGGLEEVAGGRGRRDDMTVGRVFKPDRDIEVGEWADGPMGSGRSRGTVIIQFLDEEGNDYGRPRVHPESLLLACNWPDINEEDAGTTSEIQLVLALGEKV